MYGGGGFQAPVLSRSDETCWNLENRIEPKKCNSYVAWHGECLFF